MSLTSSVIEVFFSVLDQMLQCTMDSLINSQLSGNHVAKPLLYMLTLVHRGMNMPHN